MAIRRPLARAGLPIDTAALARYLIGKIVVRTLPEGTVSGRIVETEAYVIGDAAGHAYRGMTECVAQAPDFRRGVSGARTGGASVLRNR
jgi:3-methyladenine DNA glycosylase Mpg